MATEGIYEHQRTAAPDRRVVMLTRSAFAGQQRNATAIWSGDISSTWSVFRNQIAGGLNFCMAGIPYWNSDIGGFLPKEYGGEYPKGPRDPAFRELYVRWFQFGAFSPLFRAHGTDFPREVWQFGEPGDWAYDALRSSIDLRYRLMPYLYSAAWNVTSNHGTMMRALPMDFPGDRNALNNGVEYMFGPGLLVAPVTTPLYYQKSPREIVPPAVLRGPDDRAGLVASYFQGMKFDTLRRVGRDSCISFDWSSGAEGVGRTRFSVRWEGKILAPETGGYEFEIVSDDGVNLWVDGRQLMDEMYPGGLQTNIGEIELQSGRWYDIRVEYYQEVGGAAIGLSWRTPSMLKRVSGDTAVREVPVYLPAGTKWWDFWSGRSFEGGQTVRCPAPIATIPLYARAGSIVPLGPLMQHATEKPCDTIDVRVYRGANGHLTLYEDENDGYGYEHGRYATILIAWDERKKALTFGERHGSYPGMLRRRTFRVFVVREGHGVGSGTTGRPDAEVVYTGNRRVVTLPD
jgi:alpha-D-xyloside xylohydrolase